jgi:hypothetical protein
MNLQFLLPTLMPMAVAWAETQAAQGARAGAGLSPAREKLARMVGVARPDLVRLVIFDTLPLPQDPMLRSAALQTGLLGPGTVGLTLGHTVFIKQGHDTARLLAHEFRHVFQYEQAGSIPAFLSVYLQQIVEYGYHNAPSEKDAEQYEAIVP